jgi:hypothetical protein
MISQSLVCKIHTLCHTTSPGEITEMRVGTAVGLPNSWPSDLTLNPETLRFTPLGLTISVRSKNILFFSLSFSLYQIHFSEEKLVKSNLASDTLESSFLNRCVIKYYTIFSGHIGVGYREIQETGGHRWNLRTFTGDTGSGKNIRAITSSERFVKWNEMKCRVSNFKWIEMILIF